ncbi:MAG: helix-turn-helix domain-containing protein [Oscillospiraceae bacterium]|jgi:transcriptional regulator with XRE-family HTH domain
MNSDFPRILTLLRKERGISQKEAAQALNVSQALLSHYEKGIRECGLDFVVRTADFYGVSCDYLLGRSPERTGVTISVEDIPEEESLGKENSFRGSVLPILNKKLIVNSLHVVFDLMGKINNKSLTNEISSFFMLSVYRMFRILYSVNPKNEEAIFTVPKALANSQAAARMLNYEANANAVSQGVKIKGLTPVAKREESVAIDSQKIAEDYPQLASSLFNLIQNSENLLK